MTTTFNLQKKYGLICTLLVFLFFNSLACAKTLPESFPEPSKEPEEIENHFDYFVELSNHNLAPQKSQNGFEFKYNPELTEIFSSHGVSIFRQEFPDAKIAELNRTYTMRTSSDDLIEILKQYPEIFLRAEPVPVIVPLYTPNDYYSQVVSGSNSWHLDMINAEEAWDISKGDSNTFIGILETTGNKFDENHPDLLDQFVVTEGYMGGNDHGTSVAHTAAGKTDNNEGLSSIGFNNRLYGITYNSLATWSPDRGNIVRLSQKGLRIINMSFEFLYDNHDGLGLQPYDSSTVRLLMQELYLNGTVLIGGAGNSIATSSYHYPASYDGVISVTAVGDDESHVKVDPVTGVASTYTHNDKVDLSAPGYAVPIAHNGGYTLGWGTSFSAPIVAGTVGLMLSANACLSPDDVEYILKTTAKPIDNLPANQPYQGLLGAGLIQADAAVMMAENFTSNNYVPLSIDPNFSYRTYCDDLLIKHLEVEGAENPIYTKHKFDLHDADTHAVEDTISWWNNAKHGYKKGPYTFNKKLLPNKNYYIKRGVWEQCTAWQEKREYNINETSCVDQQNYRLIEEFPLHNNQCVIGYSLEGLNYFAIDRVKFTYTSASNNNHTITTWDSNYPFHMPIPYIRDAATITAEIYFHNGETRAITKNRPHCNLNP